MNISDDHRTRLSTAAVSDISDAMESLGLRRAVIVGFRCSIGEHRSVVGQALTIRQVAKPLNARNSDRLTRHGEVSKNLVQAGDFVVLDAGARTDIASWGANHSARCLDRGAAGVLVNGATRDIAEIRRMGFPIFHLGTSPVSSRWDQATLEIDQPVVLGNVLIRARDIIVGDEDGLIVLPVDQVDAVLSALK